MKPKKILLCNLCAQLDRSRKAKFQSKNKVGYCRLCRNRILLSVVNWKEIK